jgi:hypothetical protein
LSYRPRKRYEEAFIGVLELKGNIELAAELAGVTDRAIRKRCAVDHAFRCRLNAALEKFHSEDSFRRSRHAFSRLAALEASSA